MSGGLKKWFGEKWVDVSTGKPCGRKSAKKNVDGRAYPACRPKAVADKMTSSEKKSMTQKKRAAGNPGGKPTQVKWSVTPSGRRRK